MKSPLTALALALSILAGSLLAAGAEREARAANFHAQLSERYCTKLREGAVPYVQFVKRLAPIYGYTFWDFAPLYPGAPVVADCNASPQRVAELHQHLQVAKTDTDR